MSKQTLIDELQAKRLALDQQIKNLQAIHSQTVSYDFRFKSVIHALEISKGFLGKMVAHLAGLGSMPATNPVAEPILFKYKDKEDLKDKIFQIWMLVSIYESEAHKLSEKFWTSVDDTEEKVYTDEEKAFMAANRPAWIDEDDGEDVSLYEEDKVSGDFYDKNSIYTTSYTQWIIVAGLELHLLVNEIRTELDEVAKFKIETFEQTGVVPIDCRSEEGVTIGLIDSLITQARLLSGRSLDTENIQEALNDLRADADIKKIFLYPTAQKTPPCVGHDKETENGISFQQWVDSTEELPKPNRTIQAEVVGYDKPIFAWVSDKRNCILLDDNDNQVYAEGERHPVSFKLVNVNRWRYYERVLNTLPVIKINKASDLDSYKPTYRTLYSSKPNIGDVVLLSTDDGQTSKIAMYSRRGDKGYGFVIGKDSTFLFEDDAKYSYLWAPVLMVGFASDNWVKMNEGIPLPEKEVLIELKDNGRHVIAELDGSLFKIRGMGAATIIADFDEVVRWKYYTKN